ncbi:hypothetical protein ACP70R_042462 [Stipagrostis hirtigluma subsp. patula]
MAAAFPDPSQFAVSVGIGLYHPIKLLLDFLERSPARSPALDAAVVVGVLAVSVVYFAGVTLVFLNVHTTRAAAAAAPLPAAALWRFVAQNVTLAAALLVLIVLPLVAFLVHAGGGR